MGLAPEALHTDRFVGNRIRRSDLRVFQVFYADPAVMATLSADGHVWTRAESAELFQRHLAHWNLHGFGTWIFRNPDGAFVGRAGLRSVDIGTGPSVELFYGVDAGRWGAGVATEIARSVVGAAFQDLGLSELVGFTLPTNLASRRVMQKLGFEPAGEVLHADLRHLFFRLPRANWVVESTG